MKNTLTQFLGGMTTEEFLRDYWQKKPLFVKGAFKNVENLATPDNLMEMGQDGNFESRMVWKEGGSTPWEAKAGPFEASDFTRNEKDEWTLIVHNLELYYKEFREIKDMMNFIPSWHFDDIMATYSVKGATVGAHIDNYNVFIFQGKGKRLWQINENPDETYIEGLAIKLLSNFEVKEEFILEEGDLLYMPPGVAHNGISLEESISYSIGYRSFDYPDMASSFFGDFIFNYDSSKSFRDKKLVSPKNINEVTNEHIDDVMSFFKEEVITRENIREWFGRYITSTNRDISTEEVLPLDDIYKTLDSGTPLFRDEFLRFNFFKEDKGVRFFANGVDYMLTDGDYTDLEVILETPGYEEISIPKNISTETRLMIASLVNQGALYFSEE